ncbi:site-2 protease family protein [Georgenia daeguensis]|uniref:Zinc metalloprotease n=1 Tax=Georgenia daeguensis TaxID=908355 RepID=A0ABP8ER06_9MICO
MTPSSTPVGRRTRSGWVIGRVSGIPVVLAPSWVLVAAILVTLYFPLVRRLVPTLGTGTVVLTTLAFVVMLFVSVLVHELAHGLTGQRLGARPREYVLTFWGGHTSFETELPGPGSSAVVSAAGPLANAALALAAWGAQVALEPSGPGAVILWGAMVSNALVAGFNLLPGLPLDGGQILEALVWAVTGDRSRGTVVAAWAGRVVVVAVLFWYLGRPLLEGRQPDLGTGIWILLLGMFLWSGTGQALRSVEVRRAAASLDLRELAVPTLVLEDTATVAQLDAGLGGRSAAVVLVRAGRPVALLDPDAVLQVPYEARATTRVGAVARTLAPQQVITATTGAPALAAVSAAQHHGPVVVLHDGATVLGVVEVAAVARAVRAPRP